MGYRKKVKIPGEYCILPNRVDTIALGEGATLWLFTQIGQRKKATSLYRDTV
jgi:hypothetical protein